MALEDIRFLEGMRDDDFNTFVREKTKEDIENPGYLGESLMPLRTVRSYEAQIRKARFMDITTGVVEVGNTFPSSGRGVEYSGDRYRIVKNGHAFDANEQDLIDFREFTGRSRQNMSLDALRDSGLLDLAYGHLNSLYEGRRNLLERMRWQFLADDRVILYDVGEGGNRFEVPVVYGVPSDQKYDVSASASDRWDAYETADGIADMEKMAQDSLDKKGVPVTVFVMSTPEWNNLIRQKSTRERLAQFGLFGSLQQQEAYAADASRLPGQDQAIRVITAGAVTQYMNRNQSTGNPNVTILLYDKTYPDTKINGGVASVNGPRKRFLKVNKVVGLSATALTFGGVPDFSGSTTPITSTTAEGAVGYVADGPVAENNFASGMHVWSTIQKEPILYRIRYAAWNLPVPDKDVVHQLKTLPDV